VKSIQQAMETAMIYVSDVNMTLNVKIMLCIIENEEGELNASRINTTCGDNRENSLAFVDI
jgi:hypothetical protein